MKHEIKFYCFPRQQRLMILYKDPSMFKTDLFQSLYIQMSAKNSKLFRMRRSSSGHFLSRLISSSTIISDVPTKSVSLGYQSRDKIILFEPNAGTYNIWSRALNSDVWSNSSFLGYPIVYKYDKEHILGRLPIIKRALSDHWEDLKKNGASHLHGDFTHFNILINERNAINYIDQKTTSNNILFDHFYFYNYLLQCLTLCETLSSSDRSDILNRIKDFFRNSEMNQINSFEEMIDDINLDECWGLRPRFKNLAKKNFLNLSK